MDRSVLNRANLIKLCLQMESPATLLRVSHAQKVWAPPHGFSLLGKPAPAIRFHLDSLHNKKRPSLFLLCLQMESNHHQRIKSPLLYH